MAAPAPRGARWGAGPRATNRHRRHVVDQCTTPVDAARTRPRTPDARVSRARLDVERVRAPPSPAARFDQLRGRPAAARFGTLPRVRGYRPRERLRGDVGRDGRPPPAGGPMATVRSR